MLLAGLAFIAIMGYRSDKHCNSRFDRFMDRVLDKILGLWIDGFITGGVVGLIYVLLCSAIAFYYSLNYYQK